MLISETFCIDAPIQELYSFLLDAQTVGTCIPGCERVDVIGENEYDSIIKTKLGTISVKFKVRTVISETVPFTLIRTVGHGKEVRNLGQFKQQTEITLKERSATETEVCYQSDVSVVGRLATFGDRIMRSKAKTMGQEFADAVKARLNPDQSTDSEDSSPSSPPQPKKNSGLGIIGTIMNKIGQIFNRIFGFFKCSKKST
jgi:carbon monoxide dehydrogenase subunit G